MVECLRRDASVALHPTLVNAPLVNDPAGRAALRPMVEEHIAIAEEAGVPFWMCTPTWRATRERIEAARERLRAL